MQEIFRPKSAVFKTSMVARVLGDSPGVAPGLFETPS